MVPGHRPISVASLHIVAPSPSNFTWLKGPSRSDSNQEATRKQYTRTQHPTPDAATLVPVESHGEMSLRAPLHLKTITSPTWIHQQL